ncbi:hypothetical protein AHiyo8_46890 [Arthrobacter sp. Hiyo8]|nr:hypothetical protein AHiyo8_46890 [Arthrobacter sp. Hiyo8]
MPLTRNPETETAPPRRKKRLLLRLLGAISAFVIVWAVVGIFLYVARPRTNPNTRMCCSCLGRLTSGSATQNS